jgi:D-alanyl-D-alanine carboxypeptidase
LRTSQWIGIAVGITAVLAAGAVISEWKTIRHFADDWHELSEGSDWAARVRSADGLLDYIAAHPRDVSLALWDVGQQDAGLFHEADTLRPVASTMKIVVLVAYAYAFNWEKPANNNELIPLEDWNALYLPGTDGGAHPRAFRDLSSRGRITNEKVPLRDIAFSMIRHSDNAATDYLMQRVGRAAIDKMTESLELGPDSTPHPLGGEMLSWRSTETSRPGNDTLRDLLELGPAAYINLTWSLHERLVREPSFRAAERERLQKDGLGLTIREQEAFATALGNRGSARGYARVMEELYGGSLPGADAKLTWELLEWSMANTSVHNDFEILGSNGGSLPGILTAAYYAKPKGGKPPRVLALFMQHIPMAAWTAMRKSFVHQEFERRLLVDDAFVAKVRERLAGGDDASAAAAPR